MAGYTLRRLLWIPVVLWIIATLTFFLMQAVPGGPFSADKQRKPELERALNEKYGLDDPVWEQYTRYMGNLVRGDLGISFGGDRSVSEIIRRSGFVSAQIALLCIVLAVTLGVTLGTLSALNHNGPLDYLGVLFATIGASIPHFVLAIFFILVFSVKLGWLEQQGWGGPREFSEITDWSRYEWRKMIMPVLALSALPAAYIARVTRASVLEVMNQDYIRTARAKGLREYRVVLRHTLKNALIPVLTVIGPVAAVLASGSFIIESMFGINGIGKEAVSAVFDRDYGLIMGTTLVYALIITLSNLVVDLLYAWVDPRIRYG